MEFDEERFFTGASRGDYLDALTAHAGLGSVVIVDGEVGSGVSTLLGQAVMALLDDLEVVRIDGSDEHDANVVVDALLRHFDVERPALPETLRHALVDGRIVVVVDNAGQLAADALATMAQLKQKLAGRLGYFFGGQPGVLDQVKAAGFAVDDVLSLPLLVAEDVQDFAWFVLGQELDDVESADRLESCGGNLGALLSELASQGDKAGDDGENDALRFGARVADDEELDETGPDEVEEPQAYQRAAPPWRHVVAAASLLVLVALLWVAFSPGPGEEGASRPLALPAPEDADGEASQQVAPPESVKPMTPTMEPVARLEDLDNQQEEAAVRREDGSVILEPVADPVMQSDPPPKDTVMTLPEEVAAGSEPEIAEPAPEPQVSSGTESGTPSLQDEEGYRHAGWLATLDDSRWFLQITATSQQDGARRVLDQVGGRGAYYQAERNGTAVWLVLSGDYSSRQAALDAKLSLPAKLREAGPFPRKMDDIRGEL